MINHALAYARRGWAVLPVWWPEPGRCACPAGSTCTSKGKHPITRHGVDEATTDPDTITKWWMRQPDANIGIATGQVSGFWVLDVDTKSGGPKSLRELFAKHGQPAPTVAAVTGSYGRHILWQTTGPVKCATGIRPGLDVRGDGGYIVAPPSVHQHGTVYEWHEDGHPARVKIQVAPRWVYDLLQERRHRKHTQRLESGPIHEGKRNDTLFRLACGLIRRDLAADEIESKIREANADRCKPPLCEREVAQIVRSAVRRYG